MKRFVRVMVISSSFLLIGGCAKKNATGIEKKQALVSLTSKQMAQANAFIGTWEHVDSDNKATAYEINVSEYAVVIKGKENIEANILDYTTESGQPKLTFASKDQSGSLIKRADGSVFFTLGYVNPEKKDNAAMGIEIRKVK